MRHKVVVLGGGFGGLCTVQGLARVPVDVTLIDKRNFHLFQPLLYQVAIGGLSPANVAAPLRAVLNRQRNVSVMLGEARGLDPANRHVRLAGGDRQYDTLVVATGACHHYFGHPEWEPTAPALKTVEDATEIRRRILLAFEDAERTDDPSERTALLTFVVVGAGPTGLELAGALAELARHTLRRDFRRIDPAQARIVLVEGADRALPGYPPTLSRKAAASLERLGVELQTNAVATALAEDRVTVASEGGQETIPTRTVLWAAGVRGSPLGQVVAEATGAEQDRSRRIIVGPDLTVPGHPEILVIGDLAHFAHNLEHPLSGVAPVAMQQGRYAARLIAARLEGRLVPPFQYRDWGKMATIGRAAAVADFGFVRFGGYPAWLTWLFVHLTYLIAFENRLLVLLQWAWNYFTWNRSARLITESRTKSRVS